MSDFLKVRYAFFTTSGTAAIFLALKAIGIGPQSRVAVPNLTFIATANAVNLTGAEVVLVDVLPDSLTISTEELDRIHKQNPIDAVIPVHVSGRSAFKGRLLEWAMLNKVEIIEDAAEAFGSKDPESGEYLGTIGVAGAFSFSPNKLITSGQGGLVVTNKEVVAKEIVRVKDQGRPQRGSGGDDIHETIGYNFKFTDLQASLLYAQLPQIEKRLSHLSEVYSFYETELPICEHYTLGRFEISRGEIPLWPELLSGFRNKIEIALSENLIGYRRVWHPISSQKPYEKTEIFPQSSLASQQALWLPSSFKLSPDDIRRITLTIRESFN